MIRLWHSPLVPSTSTHSCFFVKKRSSLLTVVANPRRWDPMKGSLLTMLDLLLEMRINPLLLDRPNLPSELIAAIQTGTTLVWKYLLGRRVACCPVGRGQVLGTGSTFQQFNLLAHPDVFLQQIAWSRLSQWNAHTPIICFGSKWTFLSGWFGILNSNSFLNVQPDFLRDMVQVT